jgi:hypothetical protein
MADSIAGPTRSRARATPSGITAVTDVPIIEAGAFGSLEGSTEEEIQWDAVQSPRPGRCAPRPRSCPAIRCRSTRPPAPGRAAGARPTARRRGRAPGGRSPVARRCRVQLGQQQLMQLLPHACLISVPQPPPAGHPGPNPSSCGKNFRGIPRTARTRCRTAPCGHPAACGPGDQPAGERRAATARSAPITRPGRSTVAAGPSSRRAQPAHDHRYSHALLFRSSKWCG